MGKVLQGIGGLIVLGAFGHFLWANFWDWSNFTYASQVAGTPEQLGRWWLITAGGTVQRIFIVFVCGLIGGAFLRAGEEMQKKTTAAEQAVPEEEDHSWRKNPFQKGAISDRVIPRGNFLQKRNRFRKTIDRPNSQGY